MAKKGKGANMSKHIKTRHKKVSKLRKIASQPVNPAIKNINKVISEQIDKINKATAGKEQEELPKIELEAMTIDSFKKLTGSTEKKEKLGKLSIDDGMYLEKLFKRWGTNYARMAQDIKLNRLQWTAQQIEKKHKVFQKMFPEGETQQ